MTKPRQLEPTVGLSHDGFEFLEGSFLGFEKFAIFWLKKSRHGKIHINSSIKSDKVFCGGGYEIEIV